ncbi:MAG: UDP-N-acetylmuramate dehydrogenase [Desulfohalobiaceae bacterium]
MRIIPEPELAPRTTLGLGGQALAEVNLERPEDTEGLSKLLELEGGRPLALGRGSNLLFLDGRLELVLVRSRLESLEIVREKREELLLRASSGLRLPALQKLLLKNGFSGLEGLVGVPASLGGAVAMNAGAFGQDLGQILHRVQIWSQEKGLLWLDGKDLELGYRRFQPLVGKGFWILLQAEIWLQKRNRKQVRALMQANYARKKANQPLLAKTCGCVFRNPANGPAAGYLLQRCGLKGYTLGGLGFSKQHANFLVNLGGGNSQQALELIQLAKERVKSTFQLDLELELCIPGRGSKSVASAGQHK